MVGYCENILNCDLCLKNCLTSGILLTSWCVTWVSIANRNNSTIIRKNLFLFLGMPFGTPRSCLMKKNRKQNILWNCPFKPPLCVYSSLVSPFLACAASTVCVCSHPPSLLQSLSCLCVCVASTCVCSCATLLFHVFAVLPPTSLNSATSVCLNTASVAVVLSVLHCWSPFIGAYGAV
jgi:hypothetical protein